MFELDVTVAAAIFFSSFALDLIAARYTGDVVALRAGRAASLSFLWHMLSAVVVIEYAHNAFYIVFVCLGGALGTYFTIWNSRRGEATAEDGVARAAEAVSAVPADSAAALSRRAAPRGVGRRRRRARMVRRGALARRDVARGVGPGAQGSAGQ